VTGRVLAVHRSRSHSFSKRTVDRIRLLEGLGVEGDAHCGVTVRHRSRVRADPSQPNLRQVHLIHAELFDLLAEAGHTITPGLLGENVTTRDLDLLGLPVGARLSFGAAVVTVTGLRNPCRQIEALQPGLLARVLRKRDDGTVERLVGVMGTVSRAGVVVAGDSVDVELPPGPHRPLTRV
jgi:MOSC domain-containing protein YiiM